MKRILKLILPKKIRRRLRSIIGLNPSEVDLVHRVLKNNVTSKVMIDVGAHYGGSLKRFAEDRWSVYAFEPDPINREKLKQSCAKFDTVTIDSRAVSNSVKSNVQFYRSEVSSGISGLSSFHPSHRKSGIVDTITLDIFCQNEQIKAIDFLKVDTEGYDLFILQSIPWNKLKPKVIVCEFEDRKSIPLGYTFHDIAKYLLDHDYCVLVCEWYPVVEYGGPHRWRRLERYPCELMDPKACGNLIATIKHETFSELIKLYRYYKYKLDFINMLMRFLKGRSSSASN